MTPSSNVFVLARYEINKSNSFMRLFLIYSSQCNGHRSLCGFSFEPFTSASYTPSKHFMGTRNYIVFTENNDKSSNKWLAIGVLTLQKIWQNERIILRYSKDQ